MCHHASHLKLLIFDLTLHLRSLPLSLNDQMCKVGRVQRMMSLSATVLPTLKGHFLSSWKQSLFLPSKYFKIDVADGVRSKSPAKQMQMSYWQYAGATLRDRIPIWAWGQRKQERSNTTFTNTWNKFQAVIFLHKCTTVNIVTRHRLFISTS